MKKMKLREKIMLMFSLALVSILFLVPTFSKYVAQTTAPFGDKEDLDYTVNSVFEVKNQNELFAAINQGYTYVQLSKDIENPLIVTEQAKDLNSDLIIDLNGIEIQRNGHDPILNIKDDVRLTVVDTSTEQTGGLYNPIGSVFNIEGGTLTVVTGTFESGPRYSEYYSYNHQVLNGSDGSATKRTLVDPAEEVKFYTNGGEDVVTKTAPIIRSYPTVTGEITYNHGNLYFDHEVTGGNHTIEPDTYCYYRTSEDEASTANDPATADWYYTYWVDEDYYEYVGAEKPTDTDSKYIQVFIYGYKNTIDGASKISTPKDYYAAIQMQRGKIEVQNGDFFSYFGVDTTACVNANGGVIDVKKGNFSSRIPNAEYYTNYGVAIKEKDSLAFGTSYFNNYNWANTSFTGGAIARKGESYCILNSGNATVSIGQGNCYSSNNNIISMQGGGSLSIGGGTFTKKNTIELNTNSEKRAPAIYMAQGQLNISNTQYDIYGKYASAIYMLDGKMTVNNSTYNIDGSNTIGIYSAVAGDDNFIVNDTDFTLTNGDNQNGIISYNGKVQVSSSGTNVIETDGANGVGIYVSDGGSVSSTNYTYTLDGTNSKGILAESDAAGIDVTGGKFTITGDNSFGIESLISGDDKFNVTDADITMTGGTKQTGIYSANGRVNVKSTSAATISIDGAEGKGIHVLDGSVTSTNYSYTLNGATSYGIYSVDGQIDISGGNVTLTSNNNCYGIFATADTTSAYTITTDGVDISVGAGITADKTATCEASIGIYMYSQNEASKIVLNGSKITSYELGIVVDGGQIDISGTGGEITTENASAVAIFGGSITFNEGSEYAITSKNTRSNETTNSYAINLPRLDNYVNTDGIYVSGGSFTSNGNVSITHTGLENDTSFTLYTGEKITSYAVKVSGTGANVNISKATITANVGGGVNCENGSITLGKTGSAKEDIVINTIGEQRTNNKYVPIGGNSVSDWSVYKSITGGHGIELSGAGSRITVYNAMIEAYMGNAIFANGKSTSTIDIYNGEFKGWVGSEGNRVTGISGIGAYYGLKVIGAATVNIKNGTFMGGNGGALITGVDRFTSRSDYGNSENTRGKVYVERGEFGDSGTKDSFYLYEGADVYLGTLDASVTMTAQERRNAIKIIRDTSKNGAQFSVNTLGYGSLNPGDDLRTRAYIYYGDYGTSNSTYNDRGYGYIYVYNRGNSIDYTNFSNGGQANGFNAHTIVNNTTARYYPHTANN